MYLVAAALGDDVDDAARSSSVFRVIGAQNQLKFLHGFLRYRSSNAVDRVVHGVRAIHAHFVGTGALAAYVESAGRCRANGGRNVACRL